MQELTSRLQSAAKLEDLTQIRAFIVRSAAEIKSSIDKMAAEGKAAVEMLRREVSAYQSKLEEAEQAASRDSLTQLHCRSWVEGQIERRIAAGTSFCVALLDLDGFKQLNDDYGHLFGDEVLKQFSAELKSACRSSDPVGRWGGDEFLIILDCRLEDAAAQTDRLCQWVCGNYTIPSPDGPRKITINASIGVAEFVPGESMQQLLARADSEMYRDKRSHKDAPLPEAPSMLADHLRTGAAAHSR
jgi:diguanylate cyclase (GGDEF)-like protein